MTFSSCRQSDETGLIFNEINKNISSGELTKAARLSDSLKNVFEPGSRFWMKADSLSQISERIRIDYSLSTDELKSRLEKIPGLLPQGNTSDWDTKGWLGSRILNGERKYFKRSASNLALLELFHSNTEFQKRVPFDSSLYFRLKNTAEVLKMSHKSGDTVNPLSIKIKYTITVDKDIVPEGEIIRCWLPFPGKNQLRQQYVKLLGTSSDDYSIAPDSAIHLTVYMEQKSVKGQNAIFSISFSYKSYAQHFKMDSIRALPYDNSKGLYLKYTAEQLPHISFSPEIRRLADSICGNENDPVKMVSRIWLWFKDNIPWTGAPEYSIIDNIALFTCSRRTGDCGMQTFLFMSMLRYKGIPVRWQSGWMIPPHAENLHDWCEVWYEGTGWVPVDVSYGLQDSEKKDLREYYKSGLDAYRMIVNNGVAGRLYPEKKYLRSEPYDFQRGEVEWSGGNLYFNKWKYDIEIQYNR
jgi:hypothetical protein